MPTDTPLIERARHATFGPRPGAYIGTDGWRAERTEACLALCVLAIEHDLPAEQHHTIARVVKRFLALEHSDDAAAQLLVLGAMLYATETITDVERLLFAEVALPWLPVALRADYTRDVQSQVDEWHRLLNGDSAHRENVQREEGVTDVWTGWLDSAAYVALQGVARDRQAKGVLR